MVLPRNERIAAKERIKKKVQAIKADKPPANQPADLIDEVTEVSTDAGSGE